MKEHRSGIAVALRKEDGFIELIFGEDGYALHPEAAMGVAKAIATALKHGEQHRETTQRRQSA